MGAGDYKDPRVYAAPSRFEAGSACDVTLFTKRILSRYSVYFQQIQRGGTAFYRQWAEHRGRRRQQAFQTAPGLGRKASITFRIFRSYLVGESHHAYVGWADVRGVFPELPLFSWEWHAARLLETTPAP